MFGPYFKFLSRSLSQISIKTDYLAIPFKTLALVYLQHNVYRTANIPTTESWLVCRRPTTSIWRVERPIHISPWSIQHRERWYATIVGLLGFKWWNNFPISEQEENKMKNPDEVFKAITDTQEVSTTYWNHIDKMYSNIKQGEHKYNDHLDQCIKVLVERCQYQTEAEKMVCTTEMLFHATKHLEVKKWVRLKTKREDVMYQALLQHAKEHKMTVRDFNQHKFNGGIAATTTIDEYQDVQAQERQWPQSQGWPR